MLIVGLGALSGGSLALGRPVSAAWARLATATAVVAAAAYGVLQVVDGVALKRAVDACGVPELGSGSLTSRDL